MGEGRGKGRSSSGRGWICGGVRLPSPAGPTTNGVIFSQIFAPAPAGSPALALHRQVGPDRAALPFNRWHPKQPSWRYSLLP